jgi:hypothetical protein
MTRYATFDVELIGTHNPVFLVCVKIYETGKKYAFWHNKPGHMQRAKHLFKSDLCFVSFNGWKFDVPLISAWFAGASTHTLKNIAQQIIVNRAMPWDIYKMLEINELDIDHIDLIEVAPGVMVNLKTYAGRMHHPTLVDLPFHHTQDLTLAECRTLQKYCFHDLAVTEKLFHTLKERLALREQLSDEYDLDLRSKSDAQISEAILKQKTQVYRSNNRPSFVVYDKPAIIQTENPQLLELIRMLETENFDINQANGSPIEPEWMKKPLNFYGGTYKIGLGGLHSQHDLCIAYTADDEWGISDIDAASYYPSIILKCGLIPQMSGNKGQTFIEEYRDIYEQRLKAKHTGDKAKADMFKILLNGIFGKLGSIFCPFYSPDLLLATTLTGQLNLLDLIDCLTQPGIHVISANTDGIMVQYRTTLRQTMLDIVAAHGKKTGFEYEETRYRKVAIKDVNNYLAVKLDGKVKAKGLYAHAGVLEMKNPTMEICSKAAAAWLVDGTPIEDTINAATDIRDFVAVRTVNTPGGGVQHKRSELIDDWVNLEHKLWFSETSGKYEKRVSRPNPFEIGVGGKPFGRVARWYMTTQKLPAITQVNNGNQVPKTEGAKLCLALPDGIPPDLNKQWYIDESKRMLVDMGVNIFVDTLTL